VYIYVRSPWDGYRGSFNVSDNTLYLNANKVWSKVSEEDYGIWESTNENDVLEVSNDGTSIIITTEEGPETFVKMTFANPGALVGEWDDSSGIMDLEVDRTYTYSEAPDYNEDGSWGATSTMFRSSTESIDGVAECYMEYLYFYTLSGDTLTFHWPEHTPFTVEYTTNKIL
jgi:hypothetical protein